MDDDFRFSRKFDYVMKVGAAREARRLGHDHVQTGHVLLALINDTDTAAAQVLAHLLVNLEDLRERTVNALPPPGNDARDEIGMNLECSHVLMQALGFAAMSPEMRKIEEMSMTEPQAVPELIRKMRLKPRPLIGTQHILLGLIALEETIAGRILGELRLAPESIEREAQSFPEE